jgi:hypothetical protein
MSHEPPVPQGNQSPFPLREPPHARPAQASPAERSDAGPADRRALGVVLGMGALVAAGAGIAAYLSMRRRADAEEDRPAKRSGKTGKRAGGGAKTAAERTPKKSAAKSATGATRKRASARSDNPAIRGARDAAHIALSEAHEVAYWTKKFGVDRAQLQAAVDQVGHGAKAVAAFFPAQKG